VNKRARWQHRRILAFVLGCMVLTACAVQAYRVLAAWATRTYAVTSFVLVAHDVDDDTVRLIGEWLREKKERGDFQDPLYADLHAELVAQFPLVARTSWSRATPEVLTCTVFGAQPVFFINKRYVVGDNGALYPAALFPQASLVLPRIVVAEEWLTPASFCQPYEFLISLTPAFLHAFNSTYHNPNMIVVWPKEALDLPHHCVCIVDQRTVSVLPDTVTLMGLCQGLKEDGEYRVDDALCLFDFRFPGTVIRKCVTPKEGLALQRV